MGLTIHYKLKLNCNSAEIARQKLIALHHVALDLPFAEVSELVEFQGEECRFNRDRPEDPHAWLKLHASRSMKYEHSYIRVDAQQAIGFSAWPGEGCESATFGLAVFPNQVELASENGGDRIRSSVVVPSNLPPWSWSSFCKTQYASNPEYGGFQNFLKCHELVIKLLDAAQELGILEEVYDEGGYWEHRDRRVLAQSVSNYNALVAGVVGGLGTLLRQAGVESEAYSPIIEYPNYEYLEAEGQQRINMNLERE